MREVARHDRPEDLAAARGLRHARGLFGHRLPDPFTVPTVKGSGKWQTSIMSALDGHARVAREVYQEILGRPPSHAEFNALHRATRLLVERGQLVSWLQPIPHRNPLLVLYKIDCWVYDGDGGRFAEAGPRRRHGGDRRARDDTNDSEPGQ